MKVLLSSKTYELVEKKSRFIANIFYVENEKEASDKLNEIRKKYYDAKHNCYAYILGAGGENVKSSDDGEPQGTAGHPMLDILKGEGITNCIAIVTRYFGGTLLGTGGLVRAYSDSLKSVISSARFSNLYQGVEISFDIDYDNFGKVENIVKSINQETTYNNHNISLEKHEFITVIDKAFEENVKLRYLIDKEVFDKFSKNINNLTRGKVILDDANKKIYFIKDKKIVYLNN